MKKCLKERLNRKCVITASKWTTADFNVHKAEYAGSTEAQAKKIMNMTPELFKSFLIQETGGLGDRASWKKDPGQVNVSRKDWCDGKAMIGLKKPLHRNEGELKTNMVAALKFLVRKGFGFSGKPVKDDGARYFEGWRIALERYNGRKDMTRKGNRYKVEYADKIIRRTTNPNRYEPIEIPVAK